MATIPRREPSGWAERALRHSNNPATRWAGKSMQRQRLKRSVQRQIGLAEGEIESRDREAYRIAIAKMTGPKEKQDLNVAIAANRANIDATGLIRKRLETLRHRRAILLGRAPKS